MKDTIQEERITAVVEAVAIQLAVLEELAKELRSLRAFGLARDVTTICTMLDPPKIPGQPNERDAIVAHVRKAVPSLKTLHDSLVRLGPRFTNCANAVKGVRRVLVQRADQTLVDTQPLPDIEPRER